MHKRVFSEEEIKSAVNMYENGNLTIEQVAKAHGTNKSSLQRWIAKSRAKLQGEGETSKRKILDLKIESARWHIKEEIIKNAKFLCSDNIKDKLNEMEDFHSIDCGRYSAHLLCELYNVTRSTFINHLYHNKRDEAWWHEHRNALTKQVFSVFAEYNCSYGADKIAFILRARGIHASKHTVREIMRDNHLFSLRTTKKRDYDKIVHRPHTNIVRKKFAAKRPNTLWFTDFAHIELKGKFYSICVILDAFSRKVVAHNIGPSDTMNLLIKTFKKAWYSRNPSPGLVFHSDNGAAMSSAAFGRLCHSLGVVQSFSKAHHPTDNAVIESFFNTFKRESIRLHQYSSLKTLKEGVAKFMDIYNNERPHQYNKLKTPSATEECYYKGMGVQI